MSDIAIRCEGLSKQYRIGERESYKALRDVITDAAASPFRRLRASLDGHRSSVAGPSSGPRSSVAGLMKSQLSIALALRLPTLNSKLET